MQTADGHAPARRTAPPRAAGAERAFVRGATRDLENTIAAHLFVVCPNNSGSSFLASALAACRAVWSLPREGQGIPGYAGPVTTRDPELADLDLRRRLPVKGRYDEVLADMIRPADRAPRRRAGRCVQPGVPRAPGCARLLRVRAAVTVVGIAAAGQAQDTAGAGSGSIGG